MSFADILGQEFVVEYLKRAWNAQRLPHAFLFAGQKGVGKTMTARALAMLKFCTARDEAGTEPCGECPDCQAVIRGKHADMCQLLNNPVEEMIRIGRKEDVPPEDPDRLNFPELMVELLYALQRRSSGGRGKFILIQNAEKLNIQSANALLKSIEEPPAGTLFVLTSENLTATIGTILSRCHVLRFRDLPAPLIAEALTAGQNVPAAEAQAAARMASGSMTRAVDLVTKRILPVRAWLTGEMGRPGEWDAFGLSETLRELAPGMVFGFDEANRPCPAPEGASRTQHSLRDGVLQLLAIMLEAVRDRAAGLLTGGDRPTAAAVLGAQDEIVAAMHSVDRNVNIEMAVDNLLLSLKNRLSGV